MTESTVPQKYITAFAGILTEEELRKSAAEMEEFAADLPPLKHIPGLVRHTLGRLPDEIKMGAITAGVKKADAQGRDLSDVVGEVFDPARHKSHAREKDAGDKHDYVPKLNYQRFILSDDGTKLERTNAQEISGLFPQGEANQWPTLVLVSNSNLASPQSFFDSFQVAHQIIPKVTNADNGNMVIAGTYFSQRHLHANALDTMTRYRALGVNPEGLEKLSPAAEAQAYQLLDLLLERDTQGAVIVEGNKPILRADAADILKHVVGYGYSAAHMTNKDAFRVLRNIITKGDVQVQVRKGGEMVTRDATAADADRIISHARLIGIAGMDRMELGSEKGMPKEANFISPHDFSNALNGPRFLTAPNVITLEMRSDADEAIKDAVGGHAQDSYVKALLSVNNQAQRKAASAKLDSHIARA